MVLKYEEVKECWERLVDFHGMLGLALVQTALQEALLQFLLRFIPCFRAYREKLEAITETIQLLSVFNQMTFYAQMGTEISELGCWLTPGEIMYQPLFSFDPDIDFCSEARRIAWARLDECWELLFSAEECMDDMGHTISLDATTVHYNLDVVREVLRDMRECLEEFRRQKKLAKQAQQPQPFQDPNDAKGSGSEGSKKARRV